LINCKSFLEKIYKEMRKTMKQFKNKTIVITGGANGIGKCIAQHFKSSGAEIAVIDKVGSSETYDLFLQDDVSEKEVLKEFANAVITKFGKIDCLINNACFMNGGIFDNEYEDFLYLQKVGIVAPFMLTKLFLPHFSENASIVNIASTRAFQSQENTESYTAAKGGIVSLTHALAVSLKEKVRVNCVSPGWINTTNETFSKEDNLQHPVGRIGVPDDIAHAVMFLASDDAGFITGQNIVIDGGMSKLMIYHNDYDWCKNL